jgi:hypothetical protein
MSTQGASITQAPTHVPMRPLVWLVALVVAMGIAFAAIAATTNAPALDQRGFVDRFDWSQQVAHPRFADRGEVSGVPEQRLYPDGFAHERTRPIGFGHVPPQRLHPVQP